MIPVLYEKNEEHFRTNGICRLVDCMSCEATEERNGIYEVEFRYPVNGAHFSEITLGRIIYVTHDETKIPQPFDIYKRSAEIDGVVTFNASHVSNRLGSTILRPYTAGSCADALDKMTINALGGTPARGVMLIDSTSTVMLVQSGTQVIVASPMESLDDNLSQLRDYMTECQGAQVSGGSSLE